MGEPIKDISDRRSGGGNGLVDPKVMANTDTAPVNGVYFGDIMGSEVHVGSMTEEDMRTFEMMLSKDISAKRAFDWLRLLQGSLPADSEDDVADDICAEGLKLSRPLLVEYLRYINAGRISKQMRTLFDDISSRTVAVLKAHGDVDRTDSIVSQGGDTGF